MKNLITFGSLVCLLPLAFLLMSNTNDIKPLPRINKEFLIVAYIIMDKDTTNDVDTTVIKQQLLIVNDIYKPIEASFTICEFRYIYNFQFHDTMTVGRLKELTTQYYAPKRINMYFIGSFMEPLICGRGSLGGVDLDNYDLVIIKKDCGVTPLVMAHELGHYFSLSHPFEDALGKELVNGSNCATAGDGICDTPADPYEYPSKTYKDYVDNNCIFFNTEKDANGDYYDPDVSNIMSYYTPCICLSFTLQQYEKMANYYLSNSFKW